MILLVLSCFFALVFLFLKGYFDYISSVDKILHMDDECFKKHDFLFPYKGKNFFSLMSEPGFNRMLFDRKYLGKVSDTEVLRILEQGTSGYRKMIFSMLGIGVVFFIVIFSIGR